MATRKRKGSKAKAGRKTAAFTPTADQRRQVEAAAGYGLTTVDIAHLIGIADSTLRLRFPVELKRGQAIAKAKVGESLYQMATGTPAVYDAQNRKVRDEQPRVPACAIFYAKTRMGFREVSRHELSGPSGPDGKDAAPIAINIGGLSDSQLDDLIDRIAARLGRSVPAVALPRPSR